MFNDNGSLPSIDSTIFNGNTAAHGGGVFNDASSPVFTNVTFSGNTGDYGGGMDNLNGNPTLTTSPSMTI